MLYNKIVNSTENNRIARRIAMNITQITDLIEAFAPRELAYPWDNVGLLAGSRNKEVKKVLLTLDTNLYTVREAVKHGCDMIISHHPIMFGGIKRIDFDTPEGEMLRLLIKNDIAVYAAHTNMDATESGINQRLAEIFELSDIKILEQTSEGSGIGRYGTLKNEITFAGLCEMTKNKLNTPCVRASGDSTKQIKTLAVASGSCAEYIANAIAFGCDAIITGDLKYHEAMEYAEQGICIIDAGHYPTEIIVKEIFADILKDTGLELVYSNNTDIFKFV